MIDKIELLEEITIKYKKRNRSNTKITHSRDIFEYVKKIINTDELIEEVFMAIFLNRRNNIIGWYITSIGSTAAVIVDNKKIFAPALECLAQSIILCHNHPSGETNPSQADINITNKVRNCAELLDITLLDHIILGENKYYSFADEGML